MKYLKYIAKMHSIYSSHASQMILQKCVNGSNSFFATNMTIRGPLRSCEPVKNDICNMQHSKLHKLL